MKDNLNSIENILENTYEENGKRYVKQEPETELLSKELAKFYKELLENSKPLDKDIEEIINKNLQELY